MAKCTACHARKGKRTCPALDGSICSSCCGSKRQKEVRCPADCHHLGKSMEYLATREEDGRLSSFDREMKSIIGHEEPYEGLLNAIEHAIMRTWRSTPAVTDRHVEQALAFLMESGKARMGLPARVPERLSGDAEILANAVSDIVDSGDSGPGSRDPMTRLKCIYRIRESVRTHHHPADERSYLRFISNFLL